MIRTLFTLTGLVFIISLSHCSQFKSNTITLEVNKTEYISKQIPVLTEIKVPEDFQNLPLENIGVTLKSGSVDEPLPGQLINCENGKHKLCWLLPETNPEKSIRWKAEFYKKATSEQPEFEWKDSGENLDLLFGDKKVFRYCYEMDDHFKKGETLTAKNRVFYHIYDLDGKDFITNGPEEGVWSHHRGIMIGWRDIGFKEQELSFWGMEDLTVQKHISFIEKSSGPVSAKVEALIHWNDSTGTTIIEEKRTAMIYRQAEPAIMMLDFISVLKAVNGPVKLDGNAEHGGVQYRAHNDVAEGIEGSKKPVYYFHKDRIDPTKDFNLPWVGMTYGLRNKMYSVLDLNHSDNPEPVIWSAYRDYGRFGPFFVHELDNNETLEIKYRFLISEDEMPEREILEAQYQAYTSPPLITVTRN